MKKYIIMLMLMTFLGGCAGSSPAVPGSSPDTGSAVEEESAEPGYDLPVVMVAAASAGVTVQEGDVAPRALHAAETLPYDGEVAVAETGELTLAFGEAGTVRCKGGTKMRVVRETAGWLLYLEEGLLDAALNNLDGREFTVVAPALTAGVRGTEFSVLALPDGTAEVFVDAGSVKVDNPLTGDMQSLTVGNAVRAELGGDLRRADWQRANARQGRAALMLAARGRTGVSDALARLEGRLGAVQQRQQQQIEKLRAARAQRDAPAAAAMGGARNELARRQVRLQQADLRRQERQLAGMRQWLTRQQGREGLPAAERARLAQLALRLRQLEGTAGAATR